ncbi:MAG: cytochrome c3 family protein [Nitrospiraceae bacterium]|nr:cytochrome c3 family protein [Nitrospiraceae bacterium]
MKKPKAALKPVRGAVFAAAAICALALFLSARAYAVADSCTACHYDAARMKGLGAARFAFNAASLAAQTGMPRARCVDCHLGNPRGKTAALAHKGFLTLSVLDSRWRAFRRPEMPGKDLADWGFLKPRGGNRAFFLMPKLIEKKTGKEVNNPSYRIVLWQDRNTSTLAFNPVIAEKTCGRCHPKEVSGYLGSPMGGGKGAHTQSQYRYWTGPAGPQICGLWLGALAKPAQDSFTGANLGIYGAHSTTPIPAKFAFHNQRGCNQCHTGCLDCHFKPEAADPKDPARGPHTFIRKPDSLSCYGGGRSFACHAGPLERRRGDGYLRAEFTESAPWGEKLLERNADVHLAKGIECVDCHKPDNRKGLHADLIRDPGCSECHGAIVREAARGVHKDVACAACHVRYIGGYAFNFWTALGLPGRMNPLVRISDYLTGAEKPLLIMDPGGKWIPVHVVPSTSGNVKPREVKISRRLIFRDRPYVAINRLHYSEDSFAVTGLAGNVNARDKDVLVWLNIDRVAHSLGKARSCRDCHASRAQKIVVKFSGGSYEDVENGRYTIEADANGLRVTDFRGPDGGPMPDGLKPFSGKWAMKGDFSLPAIRDRALYRKLETLYKEGRFSH